MTQKRKISLTPEFSWVLYGPARIFKRSNGLPCFVGSARSWPVVLTICFCAFSASAAARKEFAILSVGPDHRLAYSPDAQGNRIPDFSYCGYASGSRPIPDAPVRIVVDPQPGDSSGRIQSAIDYVASLAPDTNGIRGAVLLLKGRHSVSGSLSMKTSGVILRGQGMNEDGTVLVATGMDRGALIRIAGSPFSTSEGRSAFEISDEYLPVGTMSFHINPTASLKSGETIFITRPSTQAWIERMGMTEFGGGIGDWRLV